MTTDTLTAEVLNEAECIVRGEWVPMLTATIPEHYDAVRTEMPVTRPRPPKLAHQDYPMMQRHSYSKC